MDKLHLSDLVWIGAIVLAYWFVSSGAPAAIVRQVRLLLGRSTPTTTRRIMSRPRSMRPAARRYGSVYVPVSGMAYQQASMTPAAPDIDAVKPDMPRLSRDISETDLIAFLAVVRGPGGKPRYSANAIYSLVGGDRNAVLARIKEIRSGPPAPVYRPINDEKRPILT